MTVDSNAYSKVADHYESLFPNYEQMGSWWKSQLTAAFPPLKPRRILDLCCGIGLVTAPLLELGHEVVAIDKSGEMLEQLNIRLQKYRRRYRLIENDVAQALVELDECDYDGFVCGGSSILHLPTEIIDLAAPALSRVLRPMAIGLLDLVNWEFVDEGWTIRACHDLGDRGRHLIFEFYEPSENTIKTSIVELRGSPKKGWSIQTSDFQYYKHSESFVTSLCEAVGLERVGMKTCEGGRQLLTFHKSC